jgi:DNA integrity scanning protein DisA with diadenylate cyclase activity
MPKQYKKKTRGKKPKAKAKANAGYVSARARELLASIEATLIQNHAQLAQSIARIAPILLLKSRQYKAFINSVTTSYEYKRKNIPSVLLTMLTQSSTVLQRVNHLLRFHNEPDFLQAELGRRGLNAISAFIELTLTSMEELEETMHDYTQSALADYRGAQLGIETQPNMRNRTTRNTDAIVRPARTTRAQALTRRIRSI